MTYSINQSINQSISLSQSVTCQSNQSVCLFQEQTHITALSRPCSWTKGRKWEEKGNGGDGRDGNETGGVKEGEGGKGKRSGRGLGREGDDTAP